MLNHYIPRLLLRQFATGRHINTYSFATDSFENKKVKNTFAAADIYDGELERLFSGKLEGPFANLLNHRLLSGDEIVLDRMENQLIRRFLMINFLRAPIVNATWDEMVERTGSQNHPSVQAREFLIRNMPDIKEVFDEGIPSAENYYENLRKAMEIDSLEVIAGGDERYKISESLMLAARHALMPVIVFWDSSDAGQEFILPKLPGISEMDYVSTLYKTLTIKARKEQLEEEWLPEDLEAEVDRLIYTSALICDNYSIYPISPTRCLVYVSPYFRAFFPIMDATGGKELYPPLLHKEQFDRHFYKPLRMELFEPCNTKYNMQYRYRVKSLTEGEVKHINSLLLDMETEEFAFHDYEKIKDSLKYYDDEAVMAMGKKHDFSRLLYE